MQHCSSIPKIIAVCRSGTYGVGAYGSALSPLRDHFLLLGVNRHHPRGIHLARLLNLQSEFPRHRLGRFLLFLE